MSDRGERPIPVRSVAPPPASAPPSGDDAAGGSVADPTLPEPTRILESGGNRWEVRAIGRSRTGHGQDAGALLLMVSFIPAGTGEDAEEGTGGRKGDATAAAAREGLTVARSLEDLDDEALAELLERSRPVRREPAGGGGNAR